MLTVKQCKLVIKHRVYNIGDRIDGLSPEDEERLIAAGVADPFDAEAPATENDEPAGQDADAGCPVPDDEAGAVVEANVGRAIDGMSKPELQAKCRELGLPVSGSKAELQARIDAAEEWLDDEGDEEPPELSAEVPQ